MTQVAGFPWVSCHDVRMATGKIGERIRTARQALGWDRERLAAELTALGGKTVTTRTLDNWENDRNYPKDRVGALERVLGVRLRGSEAVDIPVQQDGREINVRIATPASLSEEGRLRAEAAARGAAQAVIAMESADSDPDGQ